MAEARETGPREQPAAPTLDRTTGGLPSPELLALRLARGAAEGRGYPGPYGNEPIPEGARASAVAAVLRWPRDAGHAPDAGPEVLLMVRAEHPGDPWSGQISLPGGRHEPDDPHLVATAIRETEEELGVDLARAGRLLGGLPPIRARADGGMLSLYARPFVFELTGEVTVTPNHEVAGTFWLPLGTAHAGALDHTHRYTTKDGRVVLLDSWLYGERLVWGLTYRILTALVDHAAAGR